MVPRRGLPQRISRARRRALAAAQRARAARRRTRRRDRLRRGHRRRSPSADAACLWHVLEHSAQPLALLRRGRGPGPARRLGLRRGAEHRLARRAAAGRRAGSSSRPTSTASTSRPARCAPRSSEPASSCCASRPFRPRRTCGRSRGPIPVALLGALRAAWRARAAFRTHPWRGELLRAVAQRPSPVGGRPAARLTRRRAPWPGVVRGVVRTPACASAAASSRSCGTGGRLDVDVVGDAPVAELADHGERLRDLGRGIAVGADQACDARC